MLRWVDRGRIIEAKNSFGDWAGYCLSFDGTRSDWVLTKHGKLVGRYPIRAHAEHEANLIEEDRRAKHR